AWFPGLTTNQTEVVDDPWGRRWGTPDGDRAPDDQFRSNPPCLVVPRKLVQAAPPKPSTGPAGFFESRTPAPTGARAISTQSGPPADDQLLLRQVDLEK